jgi:hypothetical protein
VDEADSKENRDMSSEMIWGEKQAAAIARIVDQVSLATKSARDLEQYRHALGKINWPLSATPSNEDTCAELVQRTIAAFVWHKICKARIKETESLLEKNHQETISKQPAAKKVPPPKKKAAKQGNLIYG